MQNITQTETVALTDSLELEDQELAERLAKIAEPENQGTHYEMERNIPLYLLGVVGPLVLMIIGWHW